MLAHDPLTFNTHCFCLFVCLAIFYLSILLDWVLLFIYGEECQTTEKAK